MLAGLAGLANREERIAVADLGALFGKRTEKHAIRAGPNRTQECSDGEIADNGVTRDTAWKFAPNLRRRLMRKPEGPE